MSFTALLQPAHLFQTLALSLSIFNLVAFLWLACTVWLNGDRQSLIARVGVVGLSLSALFFYIHSLLISGSLAQESMLVSTNFLWHLIWLPALGVPYIWFVIGLYYASLMNVRWQARRPLLLAISAVLGCCVLLLLIVNRATFSFKDTLLLLSYGVALGTTHVTFFSPLVWLPILFLLYVTFCAIGPWFTPARIARLLHVLWLALRGRRRHQSLRRSLTDAFWHDQVPLDELEEPHFSWHLARPGLLLAALLMVGLTISLGVLGVNSMLRWLETNTLHNAPMPGAITIITIPLNLLLLDIYTTGSVAVIILLIGYSIVRYGILIERPLAHRGFFEQWRGIVIVATTVALFIALLVQLTASSLGSLLLITSIATGTYALFTWSSYTEHDRYVSLLEPFLRSTNVRHWLNTDLQKTEQSMETLFSHLCQSVLEVQCARLDLLSGPVHHNFSYRWPHLETSDIARTHSQSPELSLTGTERAAGSHYGYTYRIRTTVYNVPTICWVLPLYDELGLVARLYLGPRADGGVFSNEDMDLARVCGQRILDTLRNHEAMLTVASLLRRRIVDVKLLGAQQRRVLHDEILPLLHLALLRMETLHTVLPSDSESGARSREALTASITSISSAHRQLASMMRAMATSAPHHLERDGLMQAIRTMLEQDFQHAFDSVTWHVSDETAQCIDDAVPPAIAELVFTAVQETLRNAARHARGSDLHRHLHLTLSASCNSALEIVVADDGVGMLSSESTTTGTGSGLLTHSALLAIAGGSLTVKSLPDEGVIVKISLPDDVLH